MSMQHRGYVPALFGALIWAGVFGATACAWTDPAEVAAGVEVLTRGPIHEAFANVTVAPATAGIMIKQAPPEPIAELPPAQRPEGDNVAWIPGYWSWDDERNDYIWISGVWRVLPTGRQWVPGYWAPAEGGYQWTSGYWSEVGQTEVAYLPPPPEPVEAGRSSPAPGPDQTWVPGCWIWQTTQYVWQPGYWVVQQPEWIWVPSNYMWTPRGCVFVPGYWDHDIAHRGVMFAPVYCPPAVYARAGFSYSPEIAIDVGVIAACLFVGTHHYYFGDYFDPRYESRFHPWYVERPHFGYDPVYAGFRAEQLRRDAHWDAHITEQYAFRREHVDARPPQTLALQVNIINQQKAAPAERENLIIGKRLDEIAKSKTAPVRFTSLSPEIRKGIQARGREVNQFQAERQKIETSGGAAAAVKPGEHAAPVTAKLPPSPVAAKPLGKSAKGGPPAAPAIPKPEIGKGPVPAGKTVPQKAESRPAVTEQPKKVETKPAPTKAVTKTPTKTPKVETGKPTAKPITAPETKTAPVETRKETTKPPKVETLKPTAKPITAPETKTAPVETRKETTKPPKVETRKPTAKPITAPETKTAPVETRKQTTKPPKIETKPPEPVKRETVAPKLEPKIKTAPPAREKTEIRREPAPVERKGHVEPKPLKGKPGKPAPGVKVEEKTEEKPR